MCCVFCRFSGLVLVLLLVAVLVACAVWVFGLHAGHERGDATWGG